MDSGQLATRHLTAGSPALEGSAARVDLNQFFQLSDDLFCVLGWDGWLKRVNPAWTQALGYSAEFLCSEPWLHFVHPEDRSPVQSVMDGLLATGQPVRFECRFRKQDESHLWLQFAATPQSGQGFLYVVAHDISAFKQTAEAGHADVSTALAFIESCVDGVLVMDRTGTILGLNSAAERLFAGSHDDMVGRRFTEVVTLPSGRHPVNLDAPFDSIGNRSTLIGKRIEALGTRLNGSMFSVEVAFSRLDVQRSREPSFIASVRDISERRRAEAEIEKLAAFPRFNPEAVLEFNSEGVLTYYNAAASSLARSLGHNHPAAIMPADTAAITRGCLALGQSRLHHETLSESRTLSWSFFPIAGTGVVHCYASDVTVRKLAEQQLAEQAALLDKASDAIIVLGLDQRVLFWNHSAERLFGWAATEAIGCDASSLLAKPGNQAQAAALGAVMLRDEWSGELEHFTRSGNAVLVESRWTLVRDREGHPKSILTLSHDVTEKRRVESQFLRAQRLESIGALASGIAHDLNNILSPIMMSVNLLQERFPDDRSARLLETLRAGVHRGADMVRQILTFTRGQEGAHTLVYLKPLISEISKILGETFPKKLAVRTNVARDLWPTEADATQLYQVLMNLCVNARDAMPQGGTLQIDAANATLGTGSPQLPGGATSGDYLAVSVADTGEGIPEDVREKIWEPFFTLKPQGVGTGLGLSTVASIVKAHGGFIRTESELGKGTRFTVFLPAAQVPVQPESPETPPPIHMGHGERILIIDDERAFQEIIRAIFIQYGYRVFTANDGTEAVALFAQHRDEIDLVVTDMEMPYLDGPATINALRRLDPRIPIIAASGMSENEKQAGHLTGTEFLLKPFTTEKLMAVVERNLKSRAAAAY
jgi:two-component system, cell cycle sensor histidine kinase and response regulator CckA